MASKIILTENVRGLGKIGDEAKVSNGYARNYLIPKGLCSLVEDKHTKKAERTEQTGILRQLELKKQKAQAEFEAEKAGAEKLAEEIAKQTLTIPAQAHEDDQLYGSVGPQQIAESLAEIGIEVERRYVHMPAPIKTLGNHEVNINLHDEVTATVKVWVVKEEI
ncbi:MAG: 50S ribosomal protein L9 [Lentisphaeria bacterium]|nr:50S ribosomal protein L9 [Lentisphaeria bacterium]NQZ67048.1 50S ribosomal protein L9 [Lentisphaeria bacterium]